MHTNPDKDASRPETIPDDVEGHRLDRPSPLLFQGLNLPGVGGPIGRGTIGPDDPTEEVPKNQVKA